jgi:type II secretory pathway component PulM
MRVFMIQAKKQNTEPVAEPETGRPAGSGEEWLGRNRSTKRKLWERLNPRSRKQIRVMAEALALQQTHARLPDPLRARLSQAINELERHLARIRALLLEVARRTPRGE